MERRDEREKIFLNFIFSFILIDPKLRAPQPPFCLSIDRYYISPCPFFTPHILLVCAECGDGQKTVKDQDILMMNAGSIYPPLLI
jgi:hypothetical protein